MKINILKVNTDQLILADKIKEIHYSEKTNIDKQLFEEIKELLSSLEPHEEEKLRSLFDDFTKSKNNQEKKGAENKIKNFVHSSGIPLAHNLSASIIFEIAKIFL